MKFYNRSNYPKAEMNEKGLPYEDILSYSAKIFNERSVEFLKTY